MSETDDVARQESQHTLPLDLQEAVAGKNFAVFLTRHGPSIWPLADPAAGPPAIVLSVPKSGTYFVEALYKRMGYQGVFVHAMDTYCNDWRFHEMARAEELRLVGNRDIPVTTLSRLVLRGQILVSHCSRTAAIAAALRGFKKIYLYRDLRETLVSHARETYGFDLPPAELAPRVFEFCRLRGEDVMAVVEGVSEWRNQPDVLAIDFAELTAPDPIRQEGLAARFEAFMGWPRDAVVAALQAVPGDDTPTKSSGPHSSLSGIWDEACERWLCEHMGFAQVVPDRFL